MSKNEKRWIVLLVAVVIIAIVFFVVIIGGNKAKNKEEQNMTTNETTNEEKYTEQLEDGTKLNTSEEFNSSKTYGNLEISNVQYTSKNGMSVLLADVKNNGTTVHEKEIVKITILGENEEVITEIKPVIGKIEPGETIKLNASVTADVANARDYKIEAVK
jgi:cytoskeletal protein RodZ